MFERTDYLEAVDSTNDYLRPFAAERVFRSAVAREQRAGRGRHGRRWHSPAGQGLYVSYLVFPEWPQRRSPLLNMIAALAVSRSLARLDPALSQGVRLKEPNDVLLGGRKLAGVLVELGSQASRIQWAILGIGVNLSQRRFDLEAPRVEPTSLALEGFPAPHPLDLYGILTGELEKLYRRADSSEGLEIEDEFQKATGGASAVRP